MRVVIDMGIRSRRYLAPRWLASPAARAGSVIGRLMRPWQRVVPLAAAVFLAAGVLAVSGRFPRPRRPHSRFRRGWAAGTGQPSRPTPRWWR